MGKSKVFGSRGGKATRVLPSGITVGIAEAFRAKVGGKRSENDWPLDIDRELVAELPGRELAEPRTEREANGSSRPGAGVDGTALMAIPVATSLGKSSTSFAVVLGGSPSRNDLCEVVDEEVKADMGNFVVRSIPEAEGSVPENIVVVAGAEVVFDIAIPGTRDGAWAESLPVDAWA